MEKPTARLFQTAPKPTDTLAKVESSNDNEKTKIFSNPKPKYSPKPSVSKMKGTIQKTNPPKEQQTLIAIPIDKEGQDLANSDKEKLGNQQEDLHIKEKETKEPEVYLHFSLVIF